MRDKLSELPFVPYEGPEPYIFVSYAHANKDKVYPIIERLDKMGYRLWYDEGIQPGKEWGDEVQRHLEGAAMMLLFLSPVAVDGPNVRSEIHFAWSKGISILSVDLEETKELKYGLGLWLGLCQRVLHYIYSDEAVFYEKLVKGLPIKAEQTLYTPIRQFSPPIEPSPETDFEWEIQGERAILTKHINKESNVTSKRNIAIPDSYGGKRIIEIGDKAFYWNGMPVNVVIPESVVRIGEEAFCFCTFLGKVIIAANITKIEWSTFSFCENLECVVLPEGVKRITSLAFYACPSLTRLYVPASVTSIDEQAFRDGDEKFPTNPELTFYCPRGSFAENYARVFNIKVQYTTQEALV